MAITIVIDRGQRRSAERKAELARIRVDLLGWIEQVEFELQDEPRKKLQRIHGRGTYEFQLKQRTGNALFNTIWEFDWDENTDELHLIEFSPIRFLE